MTADIANKTLSAQEIEQFDTQGFVVLPQVLSHKQLQALRQFADQAEQKAMDNLKSDQQTSKDFVFSNTFLTTYLNRLLHFHLHGGYQSLYLLGHPTIVNAAQQLCGDDFVATVDMMIYKHANNHAYIPWHQDLIYDGKKYRVMTAGVYLDDAPPGSGALKVIPGTQHEKQDICQIVKNPPDNAIEVNVKAGDVLLHNPMMVHSSTAMESGEKRRTLYYEFRPMAQAQTEETWPWRLLERRLNLLTTAIKLYQQHHPNAEPFHWHSNAQGANAEYCDSLDGLYAEPIPFNTVNYCKEP